METYGDPHLHPGYYPIMSQNDNGGCNGGCNAEMPARSKPLVENYGDPHLHSVCYPTTRFQTMCERGGKMGFGCDASLPMPNATNVGRELKEGYGDPHLHHGYYEDSSDYNTGGCNFEPHTGPATCDDIARANERKTNMEQRAGNNPFVFEEIPKFAHQGFVVGTGCMNPECHCKNCQGDCLCQQDGMVQGLLSYVPAFTVNNALNLVLLVLIAMFIYKRLK